MAQEDEDRIAHLMATPAEAREIASDAVDPSERAELDELDDIRALLADPTLWDEPSAGLGDAVVASIAAAAAEPTTASHSPVATAVSAGRSTPARRPRGLFLLGAAALGAAAASVVAFAIVHVGDDDSTRSADSITLVGTDLLPGATGRADITTTQSGVEIELDVPGLPRRDGADFYEAWLKNDDGSGLIPVGTFHSAEHVTLWAGVSVADYPILTVTRESVAAPKDAAQGSSGEVVVSGRLDP